LGGAQAIAALAYGTETVPKVDKVFGPGSVWVTEAKAQVDRDPHGAGRDYPAGPSEVLVIADAAASPAFVAADLLSQAEHGADSQVLLLTTSAELASAVAAEVERQKQTLPRRSIVEGALGHSAARDARRDRWARRKPAMSVLDLARAELRSIRPYTPGQWEPGLVRLNANESPWRAPGDTTERGLNVYPPPRPSMLTAKLAVHYGVDGREILVTRGSSEAIDVLIRGFCTAGR